MAREELAKQVPTRLVVGTRPIHTHKCGHECNSPYCEDPKDLECENCGGPPRVQPGYEPWRGR